MAGPDAGSDHTNSSDGEPRGESGAHRREEIQRSSGPAMGVPAPLARSAVRLAILAGIIGGFGGLIAGFMLREIVGGSVVPIAVAIGAFAGAVFGFVAGGIANGTKEEGRR